MNWAKDHDYDEVRLWVHEKNKHAIDLYLRTGFRFTDQSAPHPTETSLRELEMLFDLRTWSTTD
ncbi:GNAT family N-acetyltransferase [Nocardia brasiliensis]|uniref:GNAT family N-acetyltransferase n=1 Tax=Nocardia brasiliensis TaxID=37326 RepID=UPI003CC7FEA4